jgi:regulator of sigma E protease
MQPLLLLSTGWIQFFEVFAALSILILLHEFGHFFFARLFKVRVEKFYLFFDFLFPFPNIAAFSLIKKKVGDTIYGLGWFPLGGYVKIAGMVDESMDKEAMALPPQPDEFRAKPAWQRLFIMLGGIIVNILVAAIAYMIIFGTWGEDYLPTQNARYGISADSTARSIGLQNGDFIIGIDGKPVERFNRIVPEMILGEAKTIQVQRGGQTVNVAIPTGTVRSIIKSQRGTFITPRIPAVVNEVAEGSAAEKMGLRSGDSIIAINGRPMQFFDQLEEMKKGLKGQPIQLSVVRKGAIAQLSTTLPQDGKLGFYPVGDYARFFEIKKVRYSPIAAVGKGFSYAFEQFGSYGQQLKLLFTSKEVKLSESVGGLITFGKSAPQTFEWESFLRYLALISIILAFMNLLPIPGLDGGYVFFLLWEMITGRKVSDKVMERATTVGLVLLLGLMLYANGLDIFRLFKK